MRYSDEFRKGYRDYVNGFEMQSSQSEYDDGYQAARHHFFKDIPYDEFILGGMNW